MKKGFTLIELLVVVLIIGILSSVALPQYKKAVDKSRSAAIWPVIKSYYDAMEVCRLGKGDICITDELDIKLPDSTPCKFSFFQEDSCGFQGGSVKENTSSGTGLVVYWGRPPSGFGLGMGPGGRRFCISKDADGSDCKAIGLTKKTSNGNSGSGSFGSWGAEYTE